MSKHDRGSRFFVPLFLPVLLLFGPTCNSTPTQATTDCASLNTGADSDGDGLSDDAEACLGTDPHNSDTDGDGIQDGTEFNYPKICVAGDRAAQRRPPTSCAQDTDCMAGEKCTGLDPKSSDSDGDGVKDGDEDPNFNGTIDFSTGETDPRLWDTDGDGVSDHDGGQSICRPDGLATVVQKGIGGIQLGHDPVFGTATTVQGTAAGKYAVVVDDAGTGVAGLVASQPNTGTTQTVTDDRTAVETTLKTALTTAGATVTAVFVGRQFKTHELNDAVNSTFRIAKTGTNSSALRDAVISALTGGTAPGGSSVGASGAFYLDVTTVRRLGLNDIIISISPTASYDDPAQSTAIRVTDLTNASAVADGSKMLDFQCQGMLTGNAGAADIIWTVDISRSMSDNQVRIANTATQFFQRLQSAGVDFRIGVFNAFSPGSSSGVPSLGMTYNAVSTAFPPVYVNAGYPNGFKFLPGTDAQGPLKLCRYVTSREAGANGYCPQDNPLTNDMYAPFGVPEGNDANEEPVAAAVLVNDMFVTNAANQVANPDWQWRSGAVKVAFMVTDEPGTNNDWGRYFSTAKVPGTGTKFSVSGTYDLPTLNSIVGYFKNQQLLAFGAVPVSARACSAVNVADLPRCVIETAGGAYVDINNAMDVDIQAAMSRLVDAIAGAASQFKLTRTPITSTIKVTVRGQVVPRSRQNGFDYDTASRTIVFYGSTYRPMVGDQVFISYRVWKGSIG